MKENIEEDLKKIESLIECFRKAEIVNLECKESMYQRCNYSHYKALENILSDYKRVLKENEDWQKIYQEEKDKQFDLLRENQKLKAENEELKDYRRRFVDVTDNELKEANYYFMYKYTFRGDELAQYINILLKAVNNSIPKQKIQDKIEEYLEYDKKWKTYTKDGRENFTMEYFKAKALQDLLESEEE